GHHLAAHFFAHRTSGKKRAALRGVLFERSVIELLDLLPPLGIHSPPSVLPEYCRPGESATEDGHRPGNHRAAGRTGVAIQRLRPRVSEATALAGRSCHTRAWPPSGRPVRHSATNAAS